MADRSITARLRLVYSEFTRGTDAAAKGLRGIGTEAGKTSKSVGRDWATLGKSVSDLGSSMTTRLTLPLVGLGVVATKAAGDFDAAFVQMQTLAGVSADEVDGLKQSVLDLAGETGKAPQELADALFFLSSSGLDAAGAMDALEVSAKASAAGLGDTVTLADAASSVMLAYADSGMTAAEAMDTLIATAKAGKAEPAAIAGQLSKLIPISAALDISFQDVGGALAALSTKAFSAEQGATGLAAVMSKLMKPSQQAQEQLDAVGLSGDRLRELLAEQGLLGTLTALKERLGDNGFIRFLEDQEAIRAGVALTTGDMEKMEEIFGQVADSAGATESAFATWAESMGAKNARAFADFQVALIKLGEVIAPIASDLMSFAADIVSGFSELPGPVQKIIVAFGALVAALGPMFTVGGNLMKVWGGMSKVFDTWARGGGRAFADAVNAGTEATNNLSYSMGRLQSGAINAMVGVSALVAIGEAVDAIDPVGTANISKLENSLIDFGRSGEISGEAADALGEDLDKLVDAMHRVAEPSTAERIGDISDHIVPGIENSQHALKEARQTIDDFDEALAKLAARDPEAAAAAFERVTDALAEQGIPAETTKELLDQYATALAEADTANQTASGGAEGTTEALADQEQQVNEAAQAFADYADQVRATFDPLFGMADAIEGNRKAHADLNTAQLEALAAQDKYNDAVERYGQDSKAASEAAAGNMEAQQALADAQRTARSAVIDLQGAASALRFEMEANGLSADDARQEFINMATQMGYTRAEAERMSTDFGLLDDEATRLTRPRPAIGIRTNGTVNSRVALRSVRDAAHSIPTTRNTHVSTTGTQYAVGQLDRVARAINAINSNSNVRVSVGGGGGLILHEGGVVPGPRGQELLALVQAGEEMLALDDPRHSANLSRLSAPMTSAASLVGAGGNVTNVFVDMGRGIFVGTQRQFRTAVVEALNTVQRKGRGMNAA